MSRTIRRKSGYVPEYVHYDESWYPLPYCKRRTGRDLKEELAKFHRDTHEGYGWKGSAPAGYRRMINKIQRAKDHMVLKRINLGHEVEFTNWKRDAGYDYW